MAAVKLSVEELFVEAERLEDRGDVERAFECLLIAAKQGYAMAQLSVGNFYAAGKGTRKSLSEAARWYKRAYKNGDRDGALNLAIDRRSEKDERGAVFWLKKAISLNNGEAFIELAKIYIGRKKSRLAAIQLLRDASELGPNDISEDARDEAESLLREWTSDHATA
jgi:TPR repeat protein